MSANQLQTVIVRLSGRRCGELSQFDDGTTRFRYDAAWLQASDARPVSLTMPLRADPYESRGLHPFFANLLPEGWLLDITLLRTKIARDDGFSLLAATCRDCMGEVEIVVEGTAP